jgi:uncharacterized integral membrane protein (TIGR00698 family)
MQTANSPLPTGRLHPWFRVVPGLLIVSLLAWLSVLLSEFLGVRVLGMARSPISPVMVAIILGMAVSNAVRLPVWTTPGIAFAVKRVLRLGIILLGIRLSIAEVLRLGAIGVPIVFGCIVAALLVTALLARAVGLPERLGTLIAVGTSICGVSAIVATGPAIDASEDEMAYAVSIITVFGLVATALYPAISRAIFGADSMMIGMFLGTAIHDTSQVTGAALLYVDLFGDTAVLDFAVVSKLTRNMFMALVVPIMALLYARRAARSLGPRTVAGPAVPGKPITGAGQSAALDSEPHTADSELYAVAGSAASRGPAGRSGGFRKYFPTFILGFLLLAVVRSVGDLLIERDAAVARFVSPQMWRSSLSFLQRWAVRFLVMALAGVGMQTRFSNLKRLGPRPFLVGLVAAVAVGVVSVVGISIIG